MEIMRGKDWMHMSPIEETEYTLFAPVLRLHISVDY